MRYIATKKAPEAIGPYSQGVSSDGLIYTSGQIPLDPATGELVAGPFDEHVRRVFENLKAVLEEAGSGFDRVLRATVYLTDLGNFQAMNAIYADYFGSHRPARTTIGVQQLPKGATVEIDLIATL